MSLNLIFCSAAVMSALNLVQTIQDDITCTNTTQIQAEELIAVVDETISQVEADFALVCVTLF